MASGKGGKKGVRIKGPKDPGDHEIKECNHRLKGQYIHYKSKDAFEGKELIKVDDGGESRTLFVPSRKPLDTPGIWPMSEYLRLKEQSRIVTLQEKLDIMAAEERKKIELQNESEARKAHLKKMQVVQKNIGSKLSEVEEEAARKSQYVLQRALELRQEQEEEVKTLNSLILATKCNAIRDMQIAEKELIARQMEEEERRLDLMMEQKRQKELDAEEIKKKENEEKNDKYVQSIQHQIKENDINRLIEEERLEEEARLINKTMIAMQKEEVEKEELKREEQRKMREGLMKANEEVQNFKRILAEEDRIADMRIKEFMRKKQEREAVRDEEINAQKAAKELECARLRSLQQKALDSQAIMDEMNAARIQEEKERQWRHEELDKAQKKKDMEEDMKLGRQKQIEDIKKAQALEIAKDEQLFNEVKKKQKELHEKELANQEKRKLDMIKHRKELLKQIDEKEKERIALHKEKFEEGNAMRIEHELRQINLRNVLLNKVSKLKETNLPDKYVSEIQRKCKEYISKDV